MARIKIGNRYFDSVAGVVVNDENGDKSLYSKPSWDENNVNKAGYIEDRPFWTEKTTITLTNEFEQTGYDFTGTTTLSSDITIHKLTTSITDAQALLDGQIIINQVTYPIIAHCKTDYEIQYYSTQNTMSAILIDGPLVSLPSAVMALYLIGNQQKIPILLITHKDGVFGTGAEKGTYIAKITDVSIESFTLNFENIILNAKYNSFFKNLRSPIFINTATGIDDMDFSNFAAGDIILVMLDQT